MENLAKVHGAAGGYDSDFSDEDLHGETLHKGHKRKPDEILQKPFRHNPHSQVTHQSFHSDELDREEARNRRAHLISMNAFERHKKFVGDYILYYGGQMSDFRRSVGNDKNDLDILLENHRFLWRDEDEEDMTWEKELAKKYYDKLFKEYCIADLSKYKENKFGFRWRSEKEVVSGKGQFQCGNKHCAKEEGLKSWEVNFGYVEQGEKRNALVKLRLCPECSFKLNYHHKRREAKTTKNLRQEDKEVLERKKRRMSSSDTNRQECKHKRDHSSSCSSDLSNKANKDSKASEDQEQEGQSESDHWRGPAPVLEEKSRNEEFDQYFEDLFL
ncbi:protein FRA10AC1 [Synchiropus splendidus]|uniref:protein FRA10AC1 n=1 Tax=Synchiropus splendidus TaxID=270530 RepID=UPI00237D6DFC|nr:protein FRA10AC1 [Synchiropus splendidus]